MAKGPAVWRYLRFQLHADTDGLLLEPGRRERNLALDLPTPSELRALIKILTGWGVEKVRLCGDDPGMREDLEDLVELVSGIDEIIEVCLTTSGIGLAPRLKALARRGLHTVNFRVDRPPSRVGTGTSGQRQTWRAVEEALRLGLTVKLNVVLQRGSNDGMINEFVALTATKPLDVRFVEFDAASDEAPSPEDFVPTWEVMAAVKPPLVPVDVPPRAGPARMYSIPGYAGRVGFISNITDHFCGECRRIGLTDRGALTSCIYGQGFGLLTYLRGPDGIRRVGAYVDRLLKRKIVLGARMDPMPILAVTQSLVGYAR